MLWCWKRCNLTTDFSKVVQNTLTLYGQFEKQNSRLAFDLNFDYIFADPPANQSNKQIWVRFRQMPNAEPAPEMWPVVATWQKRKLWWWDDNQCNVMWRLSRNESRWRNQRRRQTDQNQEYREPHGRIEFKKRYPMMFERMEGGRD